MTTTLSMSDRWKRYWYLEKVEFYLDSVPGKRRRAILRDLRENLTAAAADVGMPQAIDDLGTPRQLAGNYLDAEPKGGPRWSAGGVTALAVICLVWLSQASFVLGALGALESTGGGHAELSFLGMPMGVTFTGDEISAEWSYAIVPWLAIFAVAFLIGARFWRIWRPATI